MHRRRFRAETSVDSSPLSELSVVPPAFLKDYFATNSPLETMRTVLLQQYPCPRKAKSEHRLPTMTAQCLKPSGSCLPGKWRATARAGQVAPALTRQSSLRKGLPRPRSFLSPQCCTESHHTHKVRHKIVSVHVDVHKMVFPSSESSTDRH